MWNCFEVRLEAGDIGVLACQSVYTLPIHLSRNNFMTGASHSLEKLLTSCAEAIWMPDPTYLVGKGIMFTQLHFFATWLHVVRRCYIYILHTLGTWVYFDQVATVVSGCLFKNFLLSWTGGSFFVMLCMYFKDDHLLSKHTLVVLNLI